MVAMDGKNGMKRIIDYLGGVRHYIVHKIQGLALALRKGAENLNKLCKYMVFWCVKIVWGGVDLLIDCCCARSIKFEFG